LGADKTDHLTIGERFAHFLCSESLVQLLSCIEGVLGGRLAMTAFVRLNGVCFLGGRLRWVHYLSPTRNEVISEEPLEILSMVSLLTIEYLWYMRPLGGLSPLPGLVRSYGSSPPKTCYRHTQRAFSIRPICRPPGGSHLKSWLVETSSDGKSWRQVAREEDNDQLNGEKVTGTFTVAGGGECHFIRLVNINRTTAGMTSLRSLRGRSSGASSSKQRIPPISLMSLRVPFYLPRLSAPFTVFPSRFPPARGGRRAPIDEPKPWSHMGTIASRRGVPHRGTMGTHADSTIPSCPAALIWSPV
jgi:hypothetical protein